jgi:hypothetical protein
VDGYKNGTIPSIISNRHTALSSNSHIVVPIDAASFQDMNWHYPIKALLSVTINAEPMFRTTNIKKPSSRELGFSDFTTS